MSAKAINTEELTIEQQKIDEEIFKEELEDKKKVLSPSEKKSLVLREQELHTEPDKIAEMIGTTPQGLRSFMNRQGYKCDHGIFKPKNFKDTNAVQGTMDITTVGDDFKQSEKEPKKYVQVSVDFVEKMQKVYDWFLELSENKKFRPKNLKKLKDLWIPNDYRDEETVMVTVKLPKSVSDNFERFCANSNYEANDIYTEALVSYMSDYKFLK